MNMGTMKWKWNHQNSDEVLSEEAIAAENRLTSIKKVRPEIFPYALFYFYCYPNTKFSPLILWQLFLGSVL